MSSHSKALQTVAELGTSRSTLTVKCPPKQPAVVEPGSGCGAGDRGARVQQGELDREEVVDDVQRLLGGISALGSAGSPSIWMLFCSA
jgi:hypothetical protein